MLCSAIAKRTGQRCQRYAMVGALVCPMHGMNGNARHNATVKLGIAELLTRDPRPLREVIADAVAISDSVMGELRSAVEHGDTSLATISRLIESARYTATMAKLAIDSGVPHIAADSSRWDHTVYEVIPFVGEVVGKLAEAMAPGDPVHARALREWAIDWLDVQLGAIANGREPEATPAPPSPARPEAPARADHSDTPTPASGPDWPSAPSGARPSPQYWPRAAIEQGARPNGVIDAEIVDDDRELTQEDALVDQLRAQVVKLERLTGARR
jgi:hypothetical protein